MVHRHLKNGYDKCVSFGDLRGQETHITISLNMYIYQLWGLHLIIV
jgi:hypothetical protein